MNKKIIGIYKITSPTKKIYIGQSIDIDKRFNQYKKLECKTQTRLYNSFLKYGIINHKFEIITECDINQLNEQERYFQECYNVMSKNGLNCRLTTSEDRSGELSIDTKQKLSKAKIGNKNTLGFKHSVETKEKMSIAGKGRIVSVETRLKLKKLGTGRTHSDETKHKLREINLGHKHSEETKEKLRISSTGRKHNKESIAKMKLVKRTDEYKLNISLKLKGRKQSPEHLLKNKLSHLGIKHSEEQKQKISIGNKNKKRSSESIERYRQAALNRSPEHKENIRLSILKRKENESN